MTPLPDGHHEHCVSQVVGQMHRRSTTDMQFSGNKGLKLGRTDGCPQDHAVPDGTFAAKALRLFRGADPWMPCAGVAMLLEVTSPRPLADQEIRRRCYARGGIPLHLLVDRANSWVTLFSDPDTGNYRELHGVAFGRPLALPAPFAFELDTSDFL